MLPGRISAWDTSGEQNKERFMFQWIWNCLARAAKDVFETFDRRLTGIKIRMSLESVLGRYLYLYLCLCLWLPSLSGLGLERAGGSPMVCHPMFAGLDMG